jgi:hypothetical protein
MRNTSTAENTEWVPRVVRRVVSTLAIGGVTFLITNMLVEGITWSIVLSVFISGVVLVVQFLAEVDKRLQGMERDQNHHFGLVDNLIRTRFNSISEATELFAQVENSSVRMELVKQLVRNLANLDASTDRLIHLFAHSEIARVSDFMKVLSERGEITYDGEDRDWLLALTRNARTTIDATSFMAVDASGQSFDNGLWTSDLGQRYLEAQQKALDRRVTIRRIFMLDDPDGAGDPELLQMCALQQNLGIQVRILDPLTLPGLHHNMFDFIVFDSTISYETTPAAWAKKGTKPTIVSTRLVLSPHRVAERVMAFDDLWAAANEVSSDDLRKLPPSAAISS